MKCSICGKKIDTLFLTKINGTYIKDKSGKIRAVCSDCQRKLKTKENIVSALG